jgi:hypothetical protein
MTYIHKLLSFLCFMRQWYVFLNGTHTLLKINITYLDFNFHIEVKLC